MLCGVFLVMIFFWRLIHAAHSASRDTLLRILKQPHLDFSPSYLWIFLCIPNNFPDRTESHVFQFLIRVWTLLIGILSSLDIFYITFLVLYSSSTFSHKSFGSSFAFHMTQNPETSAALDEEEESRNPLTFYTHTHTDHRWGGLPLGAIQTHLVDLCGQNT